MTSVGTSTRQGHAEGDHLRYLLNRLARSGFRDVSASDRKELGTMISRAERSRVGNPAAILSDLDTLAERVIRTSAPGAAISFSSICPLWPFCS